MRTMSLFLPHMSFFPSIVMSILLLMKMVSSAWGYQIALK